MEKKCKKCGTTENVNFDGMCKECYENSIAINEAKKEIKSKKRFFKDRKNIAITILSVLVVLLFLAYPNDENKDTVPTSTVSIANLEEKNTTLSNELTQAKEKIKSLEDTNQTLIKEKEDLTAKLNSTTSTEELQKTIDEKNQYILNLEAQVGSLTAEKAQAEAQNGILQQQLESSKKTSSASTTTNKSTKSTSSQSSTDTSATVYITDTGSKYHRGSCSYLRSSKYSISKNSAISQGYTACSRCNP